MFPATQRVQVYTKSLRITNKLKANFDLDIKAGSSERYTVTPCTLRLRSEETAVIEIKLRVLRFALKQKAVDQGHRDVFHIKVGLCLSLLLYVAGCTRYLC
jgi:hypothetical protein